MHVGETTLDISFSKSFSYSAKESSFDTPSVSRQCCRTTTINLSKDIPAAQSENNESTEGMSRIRVVAAWFYARSAPESQPKLGYLPVVDCRALMDVA